MNIHDVIRELAWAVNGGTRYGPARDLIWSLAKAITNTGPLGPSGAFGPTGP
ncbi:MAG TPA: hypothetical protein VHG51_02400 [Longimicrobiaceae bacterium]|nr:hypothetical protein [Longimicrobiaceae bacterium]